jgi:hypothetical protein
MTDQTATPHAGGCFCGAVRYAITAEPRGSAVCHCRMCQKSTGAPFYARALFPREAVSVQGETRAFRSSEIIERRFCPVCGASLFASHLGHPEWLAVTLATLDDPDRFPPTQQLWTSSRIGWMAELATVPEFTEGPLP